MTDWRVVRKSDSCSIINSAGRFVLTVFEMMDPNGRLRSVPILSTEVVGNRALVRINSACLTGEIFGHQRCDCAWQLSQALRLIAKDGNGMLIYSEFEEGRGSGIFNKVNSLAYSQRTGVSSSAAFRAIGLPVDQREYTYAAVLLNALGITSVRALSNNPSKTRALRERGISVTEQVRLVASHRSDLKDYFVDKVCAQGHEIDLNPFELKPV